MSFQTIKFRNLAKRLIEIERLLFRIYIPAFSRQKQHKQVINVSKVFDFFYVEFWFDLVGFMAYQPL